MNKVIDFMDYQLFTSRTAIYPREDSFRALMYTLVGLSGEAGELLNKFKKIYRDKNSIITDQDRYEIAEELGDVLYYITRSAVEIGYDLEIIALMNQEKLLDRLKRGKLSGSGDHR